MTSIDISRINQMLKILKVRIGKNTSLSVLLLVVVISSTGYVIKSVRANTDKPSVYLNNIELVDQNSARQIKDNYHSINVKIIDTFHLPKSLDGKYLSTLRLGLNNELYIRSYTLKERGSVIVKIDKSNNGIVYNEVILPPLSYGVSGYDIDERGYFYVAQSGGDIIVTANDGKIVSTIPTGDFRPTSLVVDKEHRIWVVGALLDSSIMKYIMNRRSQDNQIRVYSIDGNLLKIAGGGIASPDVGLASLTYGGEEVSLVSHYGRTALYKFDKNMQLAQAKRFPFEQFANYKQSDVTKILVDQPACGVTNMQASRDPLVMGIITINRMKIWYGNMRSDSIGVYGNGFIGAADMQDNPLTPCIVLPAQFRAILGADSRGHIYVVDRSNGDLVIHKVGINIDRTRNTQTFSD